MGHIYRCLAIAKTFSRRHPDAEIFFELQGDDRGARILRQAGIGQVRCWPGETPPDGRWEILVVDRLAVRPEILKSLKSNAGRLVSFDDTGPGHFEADLAINALYPCPLPRPDGNKTVCHDGFDYLVLSPEFTDRKYDFKPVVQNLFLTQGGADTYGITSELVARLRSWFEDNDTVTLNIHSGPAFASDKELTPELRDYPAPVKWHHGVADLPALMSSMDMAISAGGIMSLEFCALGVPLILVSGEKKELETMATLARLGAAENLGYFADIDGAEICAAVSKLARDPDRRETMSVRARGVIDGKGLDRCINLLDGRSR